VKKPVRWCFNSSNLAVTVEPIPLRLTIDRKHDIAMKVDLEIDFVPKLGGTIPTEGTKKADSHVRKSQSATRIYRFLNPSSVECSDSEACWLAACQLT
jgi:hypothetical protein